MMRGRPPPQHMSELAHDPVRLKLRDSPQLQSFHITQASDVRGLEPMQTPRSERLHFRQTSMGLLDISSPSPKPASIYSKQLSIGSPVMRTVTNQSLAPRGDSHQHSTFPTQFRSVSPVPQREASQPKSPKGRSLHLPLPGRMAGSLQVPMQPSRAPPSQRSTITSSRVAAQVCGSSPVSRTRSPGPSANLVARKLQQMASEERFSARASFTIPRKELGVNRQSCSRRSLRMLSKDTMPSGPYRPNDTKGGRFVPFHHAACRIQRAWRMSRWRRNFISFSRCEVGWLGTLDWLQRHNLLYGTELADAEDVNWWMQQREGAPLDREVDPWGCKKLHEHLQRVWYGRTAEEMSQDEILALQAQALAQAQAQAQAQILTSQTQATESDKMDEHISLSQNAGAEPKLGHRQLAEIDFYRQSTSQTSILRSPVSTDRSLDLVNISSVTGGGGAIGSSRGSFAHVMNAASPIRMTTSLSPRRAATQLRTMDGDTSIRVAKSQTCARQHAMYQASPPQTHRPSRNSSATPATISSSISTSLPSSSLSVASMSDSIRARSPVSAQRVQGSMSQPGLLSVSGGSQQAIASIGRQPFSGRSCTLPSPHLMTRIAGTSLVGGGGR
mmetsp:Transcript_122713/g.194375  ORF Transcript_122713/g.194375 Transcript_122713/m.194375 type:complete len:614 (+) Transcript_122713:84-1925(+)